MPKTPNTEVDSDSQHQIEDLKAEISALRSDINKMNQEFYKDNFPSSQDFQKYVRFNSRLKVPHSASDPTVGDVGDVVEVGGKLKICTVASSTAPTWVICGTQS